MRIKLLLIFFPLLFTLNSYSQCGPTVPTFNVNLTGNPTGTWTSPSVQRVGNCCGTSNPDKCVDFIITLDPNAVGISFDIIGGAVPGGALFYQVGCGPPHALGAPICLSGVGPHMITFCKPGNNQNVYQIKSIPKATSGTDITVNDGCIGHINATGYNPATVTWNSISPGAPGAYNNYLSFPNGPLNPTVTGSGVVPPYVDYVICGQPAAQCNFAVTCDTVRVTFHPTLLVNIIPINPTICFGQTSTTITAVGSGGTPPYSYLWNSVNPSASINVGSGNYNVVLSDASGCPPTSASVTVTSFSVAITANAGLDDTTCSQNPATTLHGSVTGASGGVWSGGAGTYSPNNTTLGAVYTPTAAELAAGFVNLTLTTTGNGTCPAASDVVKIYFMGFTGTVAVTPTNVSCFGGNNGSATVSITGGIAPFTYLWNTVPAQSGVTANNLTQGTYSVTMTNGLGCTSQTSVVITQPTPLAVSNTITNVSCSGGNNGSVTVTPSGGTAGYTYLWSPGGQTTATLSGVTAGTYTVTVKDSKNCILTTNYTITQPLPLAVTTTQTNVSCFGGSNGTATSTTTGGTLPYTYSWSPSGGTASSASGLAAGIYTVTVTDSKGCITTNSVTITQPPALAATTSVVNETCNYLNNGSATANPSGGTPGYAYLWQPGNLTTATINGLASGTYTLTVTDSKGCTATAFATITEPVVLAVSLINQTNVSCFGGNNGSVTASPSGGTPAYSYSWSPGGATTATVSGLIAGTYSVTVTDSKGCLIQNQTVITQPLQPLTATGTVSNVSCNAGSNGSITATPAGGTAPYTYLWSPGGQTTATISGQAAGTYTVTVTDSKGCTFTANYTITQPAPLAITFTQTNVSCFNGSNGTATATVTGGTSPYTYSWSPSGGTASTASGLAAGTYTVTVTDSKGCIFSNTVTITQPPVLSVNVTTVNETCDYLNNGSATAAGVGGTSPYTYSWSPGGATTATISSLAAGTYTVTATDNKGCTATNTAVITEPLPLAIAFNNQVNVSCFGGSDGSVSATPSGGTANYSYLWMPGGATTNSASGLSAGTYTLTITDANGCTFQSNVTITQPPVLTASPTITNASCNAGSNGSITATPAGGTAPYTYLWSPGGQTTATISGQAAGTYTVTVTDSKGCTFTANYTITQPAPLAITFSQTNVSCFNGSNGTATATVTGGTSPYTYSWSPSGGTASTASGLAAGTYTVTVTDSKGCIFSNTVTITQPPVLSVNVTTVNETCNYLNNGSATAAGVGGTSPYTYSWSPGGQTTATISGQAAGTYTVTATDNKGCTATNTAVITEPLPLAIAFNNQINVSCFGGSDGSVSATPSGGTANYSYLWMPGGATTNSASGLSAGTYTLTITDANGCTFQSNVTITQPPVLTASPTVTNASCNAGSNGSITATPAGGTAPYTYLWSPGGQTTATISGQAAGTYTVTVTDSKGCTFTANYTITQPAPLAITFAQTNVSCFNGSNGTATATVTGGTSPYTYSWSPSGGTASTASGLIAGTYTVTVSDSKGCIFSNTVTITQPPVLSVNVTTVNETCNYLNNGSATAAGVGGTSPYNYSWSPGGQTTATINSLTAGTYTVTATDNKGCTATNTAVITEPLPLAIAFNNQVNVSCFGGSDGSVSATPSGGTANYSYLWMPGGATTNSASGLSAGTYTLTITDANGCTFQSNVTITQPPVLTASPTITNASCNAGSNGSITATPAGGTAPYTYLWSPGGQTTATISGQAAGTYTVTVTDSKGCTFTANYTITQPAPLAITFSQTNVSCFNGSNGTATATVTGGTSPYTYSWSPSGGTASTASGLAAGTYTVTVTDSKGCIFSNTVTITQPPVLSVNVTTVNETCNYLNNGSATAAGVGGTSPYTYSWSPGGATTATISSLAAGTYTVTATDNKGCTATNTAVITEPLPLAIAFNNQVNVSCFGGSDGSVSATPSGGTANYSYLWMPGGATTNSASGLSAGTYTLTITDANGCTFQNTVTITQPLSPLSVAVSSTPTNCFDGSDGTASSIASGGTGPYTYYWRPGTDSTQNITGIIAGTYTVTAEDSKGCAATNTIVVNQPSQLILTTSTVNSNCGTATGKASVTVTGGFSPYAYSWSPTGGNAATATSLFAGPYTVTVTDNHGCIETQFANVNDNTAPTTTIFNVINVTCYGGTNGSASVGVAGGIGPFTYLWAPSGGNGPVASGLSAGSYTVTVVDLFSGCESNATTSPDILQPPPIVIDITTSTVNCFGGTNGTATATVTGGTPGYDYSWSSGVSTGANVTNLAAGTYTLQITDTNSCVSSAPFTITEPSAALSVAVSATPASCNASSTGSVTANAAGGTAPYNYSWMPGNVTGQSISNLPAGTYTVTAVDSKGCSTTNSVIVTQPTPIVLTPSSVNSNCTLPNGQASVVASGGTPGYSYQWSPSGGTSATATGLAFGSYTVTVTDANGCIKTATIVVNDNPGPTASITSHTDVSCFGGSNGTATATPTGGSGPFSYAWSPSGGTSSVASGLTAGTYSVVITDANGCASPPAASVTITQPSLILVSVTTNNVSCLGGNNGSATVSATGGTPGYVYQWLPQGTGGTTISGLAAGTYSVQVTDTKSCVQTATYTITQPAAALSVSVSATPASCNASSTGSVTANAAGGTAPYNYSWMPGNVTGQSISNLPAGTYTVTAVDSKGCSTTNSVIVTQPTPIVLTPSSVNSNCTLPNGQASVVASGGTPGYSYQWSPSGGTSATATGLAFGSYTVTVTDANGCIKTATIVVNDNPGPTASITSHTDVSCFGGSNGTATATPTGGSGPFSYAWSPSGGTSSVASGLTAGTYSVVITDANGCASPLAASVTITQPSLILVSVTTNNVSCLGGNNGSATVSATGGTPGYVYQWLPQGTGGTTISGLAAGTYSVQVTDTKSCVQTATYTITQPAAALSVSVSATPASCNASSTGSVTANAAGGTGPYNYSWMPGNIIGQTISNLPAGTYTVTAVDSKGCSTTNSVIVTQPTPIVLTPSSVNSNCTLPNGQASVVASGGTPGYSYQWSPSGGTNATATGLAFGSYTVTVTDANGCIKTATIVVNDNPGPTASITSHTDVSCFGGSNGTATATPTGGSGPFSYAWSPSGGTAAVASGLTAGTYSVVITDANGCASPPAASVTITQPSLILVSVTTNNVSCLGGNNGSATVSATGGTPGYVYQWLPQGTGGTTISGLAAGTYSVQVTDTKSCVQTATYTITQPAAALSVSVSATPASCNASSTGSVTANAAGGTGPYNYSWMPGNIIGQTISNLPAGTYTVTAVDSKGCSTTNSVIVTQPTPIVLTPGSNNASCGAASGVAFVTATGGTPSYSYLWSPVGGTGSTASAVPPGTYTVTVTDMNGCVATTSIAVNNNPGPIASVISTTNVKCFGGSDGTATASTSGGSGPFSYSWAPIGGTGIIGTGLPIGTYTVTITDANGCVSSATSPVITQPTLINISVTTTDVSCTGGNNGTATAIAGGGTPGYVYQWLPSGTFGSTISTLTAGTYTIQVTDTNSCVQTNTFSITQPSVLTSSISSSSNVSCFGGNNGSATVNANGGTPFYSYNWLPYGGTNSSANGLGAGTYTVTVTDGKGCSTTSSITITQPTQALSATGTGSSTSCFGGSDGTGSVTAIGGTSPYSYLWSPAGGTGSTASGLNANNYTILITDANSCQTNTSVTITEPPVISATLATVDASCGFNNGTITSLVSGGTGAYSYLWTPTGATSANITGVGPGSYSLQIKDANNCVANVSATLTNIPGPTTSISSVTNVSCFGGNDGTATVSISSGSAPFTIDWSPYGGDSIVATGLIVGSYTVNVVDSLGCTSSSTATITEPTAVGISISSVTPVSCNGGNNGSITVTGTGGTGSYNYSWSPVTSTSSTVSGLAAGSYTVNVSDVNSCTTSITIDVTQPATLISSIGSYINPTCYGSTNGIAAASVSGGTLPYSYLWSNGQTGSSAVNIAAGSYIVNVTDFNGCTDSSSIIITQPTQVITSAGQNDTICLGSSGSVSATATGGAGNYYYAWQPGAAINSGTLNITPTVNTDYAVIAYDQNGCVGTTDSVSAIVYFLSGANVDAIAYSPICPGQVSTVYVQTTGVTGPLTYIWNHGLGTGPGAFLVTPSAPTTYIVTVSNSCGASVTDSASVTFNPPPTVVLSSDTNLVCVPSVVQFNDNSITGNVADPITSWLWNFGDGTFATGQNPTHSYSAPGTYPVSVTVTTNAGCTNTNASAPFIINAYPFPHAAFTLNSHLLDLPYDVLVATNTSTGASTYLWDFGDGGSSTVMNAHYLYSSVGIYPITMIATSAHGCSDTAYDEVTTNADVIFPTAFTPNEDGSNDGFYDINSLTNDVFFPYTSGVVDFKLQIFNRWGELVFETFDIKQGWNGYYRGKICQQDVYIWKAYVKLNNGRIFNKTGDVTLLR